MIRQRVLPGLIALAVTMALVGANPVEAQSAAQFVGKWTITFAPMAGGPGGGGAPGGAGPAGGGGGGGGGGGFRGGPTVLEVTQSGGVLAATMTGGMGGGFGGGGGGGAGGPGQAAGPQPRAISDVKVVNGALVLTYTQTMGPGGQAVPVTLTLTPDGAAMKAEMNMGNGRVRSGTAVKG